MPSAIEGLLGPIGAAALVGGSPGRLPDRWERLARPAWIGQGAARTICDLATVLATRDLELAPASLGAAEGASRHPTCFLRPRLR